MSVNAKENTYYNSSEESIASNVRKKYILTKRLVDIVGSVIGLILLTIIFLIITILIKLEDPKGKVFFKQLRVGKDGKEFYIYKFRSMYSDAEERLYELLALNEIEGAMFKLKNDPRVTRIGKMIRKTSLDELPQLINVLKGEMSLVGPRPPLPAEVKEYSRYDMQRLLVTPGCSGLWQVSGRNALSFKQMVELDIEYIKKRSILLDLKIIFLTFKLLLGSRNAY